MSVGSLKSTLVAGTAAVMVICAGGGTATAMASPVGSAYVGSASHSSPVEVPAELDVPSNHEIDTLENSRAIETSEEWGFLAVAAARAIVAGARVAGPAVYNALVSTVRAGYNSFNGWCVRNPALCAVPTGIGGAALYDALKSIIN